MGPSLLSSPPFLPPPLQKLPPHQILPTGLFAKLEATAKVSTSAVASPKRLLAPMPPQELRSALISAKAVSSQKLPPAQCRATHTSAPRKITSIHPTHLQPKWIQMLLKPQELPKS